MPWLAAAAGAIAGLIAGSFIATLVIRWPLGRSVSGRSHCDACGITLGARNLVPLLSFLLQRGRCSACGAPIDRQHVVIECFSAAIAAVALWTSPDGLGATGALFGWLLLALAALDARHFWLPDRLTGTLALSGAAVAAFGPNWLARAIGGVVGFASLWLIGALYRHLRGREGLGGGDAKLFGGIGLWLGWQALPFVLLAASLIGLSLALVMHLRGQGVKAATRLPLGTLLAVAAFPAWVIAQS